MVHGKVRNTEGDLLVPDVLAEDGVEHGTERSQHHLLPGHGSVAAEEGHVPHGVPGGEVLQQGGPVPGVLQFGHVEKHSVLKECPLSGIRNRYNF